MRILLSLIGIVASIFMIKYREQVGNMLGESTWADKLGGIYNVVVIIAVLLLLWCIAALTNTEDILLRPLLWILPIGRETSEDVVL